MKIGRGIKTGFKWTFKPFVNVNEWVGFRSLTNMTTGLAEAIKAIFVPQKSERSETFEESIKRLDLSEADIKQRERSFLRIALFMAFLGVACIGYTLFLFWNAHFIPGLLALILTAIILAYAYRFHFWYFQVKNRKLGCTFDEWFNAKISGEKQ